MEGLLRSHLLAGRRCDLIRDHLSAGLLHEVRDREEVAPRLRGKKQTTTLSTNNGTVIREENALAVNLDDDTVFLRRRLPAQDMHRTGGAAEAAAAWDRVFCTRASGDTGDTTLRVRGNVTVHSLNGNPELRGLRVGEARRLDRTEGRCGIFRQQLLRLLVLAEWAMGCRSLGIGSLVSKRLRFNLFTATVESTRSSSAERIAWAGVVGPGTIS